MKLITEHAEDFEVAVDLNEETGKKSYFIEGVFMQGDIKNRNGRVYPSTVLENEMSRYEKEFITPKRALGELGHPNGPTINADRVSHLIVGMKREKNDFIGKAKILSTPMGEIVKNFIDEGVKIGVSTRGLGSVKALKDGTMEVQEDFHLSTVDIVTDPSAPNAFVNGIMENVEYYYDIASGNWLPHESIEQVIEEIQETVERQVRRVVRTIDEKVAQDLLSKFISSLKN